jgi:hypothetical protein
VKFILILSNRKTFSCYSSANLDWLLSSSVIIVFTENTRRLLVIIILVLVIKVKWIDDILFKLELNLVATFILALACLRSIVILGVGQSWSCYLRRRFSWKNFIFQWNGLHIQKLLHNFVSLILKSLLNQFVSL